MELMRLAYDAGSENTSFDAEIRKLYEAKAQLMMLKAEAEHTEQDATGYDERMGLVSGTIELDKGNYPYECRNHAYYKGLPGFNHERKEGSNCDRCTVSEPTLPILLQHVYLEAYGQDLLASENAVMTLYGLVARKDGSMLLTPADAPDQGEMRMI